MQPPRQTHRRPRRAGVTLTELLVAVSIVGILVGLTFTAFSVAQHAVDRLEGDVAKASPQQAKKKRARVATQRPRWVANQYLVTFRKSVANPQAKANRLAQTLPASLVAVYSKAIKGCTLRIQPTDLSALKSDPAVAWVEQDQYVYAATVFPTGVSRIQAIHAPTPPPFVLSQPFGLNGTSINGTTGPRNLPGTFVTGGSTTQFKAVAVIDTGIDNTHPDLNVVLSMGFGQPNGFDQNSHGTHVSGIIGARGIGVVGVFPGVPLWSLRVLDANGAGTTTDEISALDFVVTNASQVSVVNMSIQGGVSTPLNNAVSNCVNAGVVVCAAAGNSSVDAATSSPGSAVGAICVAAMCDTDGLPGGKGPKGSTGDADDTFAGFSNFGPVVSVIAPGVDIFSTFPVSMGSYAFDTGTSMASPHVAGLCALAVTDFGPGGATGGIRNLPGGIGTGLNLTNPPQVLGFLLQNSVERIAGITTFGDTRKTYPMVTGRF
jgi:prepilin-type N-terminal cleavage/methylation domain-containing protein